MPRSPVTVKDLLDAGLLIPGEKLQLQNRQDVIARVTKEGMVAWQGTEYTSPSTAATAARGMSTNGWTAWRLRREDGFGQTLADLRAELISIR